MFRRRLEWIVADSDAEFGSSHLAENWVTSRPGVMGGAPCFSGTRIPVHDIADMMANGDTPEALAAAYPQLTIEQVKLAPIYVAQHPRRTPTDFRPAWRQGAPITSRTLSIDDLPPAS